MQYTIPKPLLPYWFHGALTTTSEYQIKPDGWFKCQCGKEGNHYAFIQHLYECSREAMQPDAYDWIPEHWETGAGELREMGFVPSILNGLWIVPGYNGKRKVSNLWQLWPIDRRRRVLIATPGCKNPWEPKHPGVRRLANGGLYPKLKEGISYDATLRPIRQYKPNAHEQAIEWCKQNPGSPIRQAIEAGFSERTVKRARKKLREGGNMQTLAKVLVIEQRNQRARQELHDGKVVDCLRQIGPATIRTIRECVGMNQPTCKATMERLVKRGVVLPCSVRGTNNRSFDGFVLAR